MEKEEAQKFNLKSVITYDPESEGIYYENFVGMDLKDQEKLRKYILKKVLGRWPSKINTPYKEFVKRHFKDYPNATDIIVLGGRMCGSYETCPLRSEIEEIERETKSISVLIFRKPIKSKKSSKKWN